MAVSSAAEPEMLEGIETTIAAQDELTLPMSHDDRPHEEAAADEPPATPASTTAESDIFSQSSSPLAQPSTEATTEDEAEREDMVEPAQKPFGGPSTSPLRMRTARMPDLDAKEEFGGHNSFRFIAAT